MSQELPFDALAHVIQYHAAEMRADLTVKRYAVQYAL